MIENEQNVRLVHELAIMPDPIYAKKPLKWYLGRSVKMAFQAESGRVEHMWVAVAEIDGPYLVGTLENHPVFITHQSCGDSITFSRCHIEAVDLTENEWWDEVSELCAEADYFNEHLGVPSRNSGFGEFYAEHFTPRQALIRWSQWEPCEDDPLTFLTEIFEGKAANHGV